MRPRAFVAAVLLAGSLARGGTALAGDAVPAVPQDLVDAALKEAGKNRPAIEAFLTHYNKPGNETRIVASRWLVANMPGKGFVPFVLRDAKKAAIPFDPLSFQDFASAQKAFDAIEKEHGPTDFIAEPIVSDLQTLTTDFLVAHVDGAFAAWEASPPSRRLTFQAFLDWVLPYRSSEEPATAWREIVAARYRETPKAPGPDADAKALYEWLKADVAKRVRFDERFYLHPTDQSFPDTESSACGRCEDITNMTVYAARARGLAVCTDYTPYWGHRDNNHAWPVLLDKEGKGSSPEGAHAAKVYRRTFAIQRDSLPFHLAKGREAPNRYLANPCQIDVTDQYGATAGLELIFELEEVAGEEAAYLCVFNAGEWSPIAGSRLWKAERAGAPFLRLGAETLYLPAIHDGKTLIPISPPMVTDDSITMLVRAVGFPTSLEIAEVGPGAAVIPGKTYLLHQWGTKNWEQVGEATAGKDPLRFRDLTPGLLYRLVRLSGSDKLERPFTIKNGKPRWW